VPSPSPAPTPPEISNVPQLILGSVRHAAWLALTGSPWTATILVVVALLASVRMVHSVAHPSSARDPVRRFNRADKAQLLMWAGGRCEHHGVIIKRCRATEHLEADHVHPHSRGGQTALTNGQILCQAHNREKRASIPFNWQLRALAKHRVAYFPPGTSGTVVRKARR
jgi:5-methylcytosine-specific restriction endonuclease McrA